MSAIAEPYTEPSHEEMIALWKQYPPRKDYSIGFEGIVLPISLRAFNNLFLYNGCKYPIEYFLDWANFKILESTDWVPFDEGDPLE